MLDISRCKIVKSMERPIVAGQSITAEGLALISVLQDGVEHIQPSAAAASEVFCGFSYGDILAIATKSMVYQAIVPASSPYTVSLPKSNLVADQIRCYNDTESQALTEGSASVDNQYSVVDLTGVITFHSGEAGDTVTIIFRYYPTAQELMLENNQRALTQNPVEFLGQCGVITEGEVFTDQFDAAVDWSARPAMYLAENGMVGVTSGTRCAMGGTIIAIPTVDSPYLGIRF